ncbi:hypothetical protein EC973_001059 [Apophysomyces ossiformis]|uniref:L-type lectin-like domain-containing protein n=1 Tax=Apophysomyces ossiformis TaxID=679940 RepID=A0A8H7BYQ4_9FUNG|nr:hypothetical protein EC973_001059 [Apophysomyces ossiformis]
MPASAVLAAGSAPLRTHSISMPYIDDELQNRWFDFGADAVIDTNRHIRLTSTRQSQSGYLWSRLPLTAPNFEVEFEFKVAGSSGHLFGDGFAMWITKQRAQQGPVFGSVNNFEGLGVFFDTYDNERAHRHTFPYISAMLGDGVKAYDNNKDGRDTELVGCEAQFRDRDFPTRAKLTYYKNNYLQLDVMWAEEDVYDTCFKQPDVKLPDHVYLGFTAHTGEVTGKALERLADQRAYVYVWPDNHDIVSVTTRTLEAKAKEAAPAPPPPASKSSSGGFFMFLLKLLAAGGLVGVLFLAYRMYENNNRMKRF